MSKRVVNTRTRQLDNFLAQHNPHPNPTEFIQVSWGLCCDRFGTAAAKKGIFAKSRAEMPIPRLFSRLVATNISQRDGLLYTKNHEWIQVLDRSVLLGLTSYAVEKLGDLLFIETPKLGERSPQQ